MEEWVEQYVQRAQRHRNYNVMGRTRQPVADCLAEETKEASALRGWLGGVSLFV